jgi:hypothetical protein
MLVRCNQGCKKSDGTTEAVLDAESNDVHCTKCDEILKGMSDFSKSALKLSGKIRKVNTKKAFCFKCDTCNKMVESEFSLGKVKGKDCEKNDCRIQVNEFMKNAMESLSKIKEV